MEAFLTLSLATLPLTTIAMADPSTMPTSADFNAQAIELFRQG